MKKKDPGHKSESIQNVVVYREDLDEIIHSIKSKEMTATVSDSGFEYESLDELIKQRGTRPSNITISGSAKDNYGRISVDFSPDRTWISSDGSGSARELWYELLDFLKKQRGKRKQICVVEETQRSSRRSQNDL